MKKKLILFNYSLVLIVLFGVLFQSVHSFEHLVKQLNTKHCHHKYNHSHTVISHSHVDFDDCLVCEYSFSNYTPVTFFSFSFKVPAFNATDLFGYNEKLVFLAEHTLQSRGPPAYIV